MKIPSNAQPSRKLWVALFGIAAIVLWGTVMLRAIHNGYQNPVRLFWLVASCVVPLLLWDVLDTRPEKLRARFFQILSPFVAAAAIILLGLVGGLVYTSTDPGHYFGLIVLFTLPLSLAITPAALGTALALLVIAALLKVSAAKVDHRMAQNWYRIAIILALTACVAVAVAIFKFMIMPLPPGAF